MSLQADQSFSHYRILNRIGQGGMGVVYRARDEKLRRDVALKVLPAELVHDRDRRMRFLREARSAAAVNHPNIATIYEVDEFEGTLFLAMELVEGRTLRSILLDGPMPMPDALCCATGIADGLARAHGSRIIHRDLKPENVMVGGDGVPKILDFGLAKLVQDEGVASRLETVALGEEPTVQDETQLGRVMGTAPYMSPEQARGEPVDARTDVFAFGATLYEMMTGRMPFKRTTLPETLQAVQKEEPVPASKLNGKVSRRMQGLIDRCLAKEAGARFPDGGAVAAAIRRASTRPAWIAPVAVAAVLMVIVVLLAMNPDVRRWLRGGGSASTVASVVALPSEVFAPREEDRFLTDAIPNSISTFLNQVEGLDTRLPPASVAFEEKERDLTLLARRYGVDAFVLSTVNVQGSTLVLNVHLAEPGTNRLLWSKQYQGRRSTYLDLVEEASVGLQQALRPAMEPVQAASAASGRSDVELALQRGLYHSTRYNNLHRQEDFDLGLAALRSALELDPTLAEAAAEVAWLHWYRFENLDAAGDRAAQEALLQVEAWATRATELDPENGRGLAAQAALTLARRGSRAAMPLALKAAHHGPRDLMAQISLAYILSDISCELGREGMMRAARLDPLYIYAPLNLALVLGHLGRYEDALAVIEGGLEVEPDAPFLLTTKADTLIKSGRVDEGAELLSRLNPESGGMLSGVRELAKHTILVTDPDPSISGPALEALLALPARDPITAGWMMDVVPWLNGQGKR